MLKIDDLTVSYGRVRAVTRLSMSVEQGEFVGLVGHNGVGKRAFAGGPADVTGYR